jgi:hypothetical protein
MASNGAPAISGRRFDAEAGAFEYRAFTQDPALPAAAFGTLPGIAVKLGGINIFDRGRDPVVQVVQIAFDGGRLRR